MIAGSIDAKVMMALFVVMTIVFTANCESPQPYGRGACSSNDQCPKGWRCQDRKCVFSKTPGKIDVRFPGICETTCCCDSCYDHFCCHRTSTCPDCPGSACPVSEVFKSSNNLLIGKLISQGASRSEVLGAARSEGVRTGQIENVQGKEVAESARQHIEPGNELEVGNLVKEFKRNPMAQEVERAVGSLRYVERKKGKVLDFETGKYVPNPVKVLAEIKASGGDIDTVEGEIVAGDAADVDVVSMKDDVPHVPMPSPPMDSLKRCCENKGVPNTCMGLCGDQGSYSSRNGPIIDWGVCAPFVNAISKCQALKSGDVAGPSGDGPQSRCSYPYECLDKHCLGDPMCGGK